MRRVHLRGRDNILKRLLVHGAAFNLALLLRRTLGVGKPRRLQGSAVRVIATFMWLSCSPEMRLRTERRARHFVKQSTRIKVEILNRSKRIESIPPLQLLSTA
jgi:hypothetical protein